MSPVDSRVSSSCSGPFTAPFSCDQSPLAFRLRGVVLHRALHLPRRSSSPSIPPPGSLSRPAGPYTPEDLVTQEDTDDSTSVLRPRPPPLPPDTEHSGRPTPLLLHYSSFLPTSETPADSPSVLLRPPSVVEVSPSVPFLRLGPTEDVHPCSSERLPVLHPHSSHLGSYHSSKPRLCRSVYPDPRDVTTSSLLSVLNSRVLCRAVGPSCTKRLKNFL